MLRRCMYRFLPSSHTRSHPRLYPMSYPRSHLRPHPRSQLKLLKVTSTVTFKVKKNRINPNVTSIVMPKATS